MCYHEDYTFAAYQTYPTNIDFVSYYSDFVLVYTLSKSAAVSTYSDVSKMITDFGQKYNPDTEKNDHSSSVLKANSQNVKDTKGNDSKHEVLGNLQSDSTGQVTSQNPGIIWEKLNKCLQKNSKEPKQ